MKYRHYKGGIYHYVGEAQDSETLQAMVVYRSEATGLLWVRPHAAFFGRVLLGNEEVVVRRFEPIGVEEQGQTTETTQNLP